MAAAEVESGKLKRCAGCEWPGVRYCSAACQKQHWKAGGHKQACAGLLAARQQLQQG